MRTIGTIILPVEGKAVSCQKRIYAANSYIGFESWWFCSNFMVCFTSLS
ncbi:hypothetical protein KKB18_07705 [bacterium]|nr:hypothetical protein [bacterium]